MNQILGSTGSVEQKRESEAPLKRWRLPYASAALLFTLAGLLALSVAGYLYFASRDNGPALRVENPERVFEGVVVGKKYEVEFRIFNDGAQPRRVVGSEFT
jgi:hypothetical protein